VLAVERRKEETDRDSQDSSRETRAMAKSLAVPRRGAPTPVFLELHILKGFKSCVLKLRILKGLGVCFAEVRILRELGERRLKADPSTALRTRS
jgi:hypothetical protein